MHIPRGTNREEIEQIVWRVDSKIARIVRTDLSDKKSLSFEYDAMGNRIAKHVYLDNTFAELSLEKSTYYVRDASCNTMAVYEKEAEMINTDTDPELEEVMSYQLTERHIYGSSRLGMDIEHVEMIGEQPDTLHRRLGLKQYELSNHLGNVLSVITDIKLPVLAEGTTTIISYTAVVISATDYSAFGVALYGRSFTTEAYRYGFNGQEKEKDITGSETHTSAEFWMYDARLGRRWDLDPITIAWISSYATMLNSPIRYNDPLGLNAGDPVKISIEGSYDNVTTASFTRACLPADADDGQIVEYSFSEGRKNMVSWKYSKESKVWCPTFYSYLECSGQISNTSSTKYEGREGWSMENLASQFGVDYKSEATLAAQIIEVTEEHSAEANMTGVVAEVVENSAEESLKEPSKYFDPDAAGGTKLLTRLKGAGKLFGALTTAYDVANHSAKAIEHIRADNTAGFIEEGAKAGLAIAAAMAAGATYGAIGGPLGMAAGIAVGVAYSYISDVDWTAKFQEWGWMEK